MTNTTATKDGSGKHALVLFSHGSLLCGSGEAVDAHAKRLQKRGIWDVVRVGYLNYSEPLFAQTVEELAKEGATHITVLPYFLIPGYFVQKSLPETLAPVQAAHPEITFDVAPAIGFDISLADALLESAHRAQGAETWRDPLTRAAQSCRPSRECPLYGTSACPKVPSLPEGETKEKTNE